MDGEWGGRDGLRRDFLSLQYFSLNDLRSYSNELKPCPILKIFCGSHVAIPTLVV